MYSSILALYINLFQIKYYIRIKYSDYAQIYPVREKILAAF